MQFREAEFRQAVGVLVRDGVLHRDPPVRNGRLNGQGVSNRSNLEFFKNMVAR